MIYENWMSYIKDDAKVINVVMPGTHNSGTMGMSRLACCQNGTLFEQYCHGVRMFDIRLRADKKGVRIAHGILKGMPAEEAFKSLKKIIDVTEEFIVISIRTYMNQSLGPIKLSYKGDTKGTDNLIKKYLSPEKYALTDCINIQNLTMGELRKSGKKYILINKNKEYEYSTDCELLDPWDPKLFGLSPEKFVDENLKYLKNLKRKGFFWFQTQQTPNPGTEVGMTWPDELDKLDRPLFPMMISKIAADPDMLANANIIAGDFMTADFMKANEILNLNLIKGLVKDDLVAEFKAAIGK